MPHDNPSHLTELDGGYASGIPLNHQLSRKELVRQIYSRHIRPASDYSSSDCTTRRISLDNALHALMSMNLGDEEEEDIKGKHKVLLLTLDNTVNIDISEDIPPFLNVLHKRNTTIISIFTHNSDSNRSEVIELLMADKQVYLLPKFSRVDNCQKCILSSISDPRLVIQREGLFNLICQLGQNVEGGHRVAAAPIIQFSLPDDLWYDGVKLGITCVTDVLTNFGQPALGLYNYATLCITSERELKSLPTNKFSVKHLEEMCVERLTSSRVDYAVSTSIHLSSQYHKSYVLCYHRIGKENIHVSFELISFSL